MTELTERQQTILRLVLREYIKSAAPVSSKTICNAYNLGISSATVRNEMAALEEMGYLMHPHTSAGRVPTELGYRCFVEKLMEHVDLAPAEQRMITHQFHQAQLGVDQWLRLSAAILAQTSRNASLVTAPHSTRSRLQHIEIISIRSNAILLIVVLQGGIVKQQIITVDSSIEQDTLSSLGRHLTDIWSGLGADEMAATQPTMLPPAAHAVINIAIDMVRQTDARQNSDVYRAGLLNILNQPEFVDRAGIQQVVRAIEERWLTDQLVSQVLDEGGVQIIIAGEGKWEELSEVGIVLTRYGVDGKMVGAMGVVGPVRMAYGRVVSVVRYVSRLVSDLVGDLYGYKRY